MSTTTSSIIQDIMHTDAERELWIIVKEHERPPFWFADEGVGNRLNRAARVVAEGRITPNSDGSYTVEGSAGRTYRVADRCSCPNASRGKSHWCYHHVAVALYIEWCRRRHFLPGQEALPLPPTTPEERLAHAPLAAQARLAAADATTDTPLQPLLEPQEDVMPADAYIPEPAPDEAPVAVLEAPRATRALTPAPAQDDDLEQALATWTTQRKVVQRFLKQELVPGTDYYQLRIGKVESKPSLSKAGAEKVIGWLKWSASFAPDTGTWEMLGRPTDLVCYVCTLRTRSGEIIGEGRGARSLKKDNGDVNKAIKMAEKSSMVSAVLRTGCLSDCFTQDLDPEDGVQDAPAPQPPAPPSSAALRSQIWAWMQQHAPEVTSREAVTAWIAQETGYELHPNNYPKIMASLEGR
jgi:hypothetical protein